MAGASKSDVGIGLMFGVNDALWWIWAGVIGSSLAVTAVAAGLILLATTQ
jgi:hypothetical protein